jgi:Zn-dependent protease
VPTNPGNFSHPRRGELFTQFAGFAACVLIATLAAVIGGLLVDMEPRSLEISFTLIGICAMLMVLDLLPLPPLPGGTLLRHFGIISEEAYWSISRWEAFFCRLQHSAGRSSARVAIIATPFATLLDGCAMKSRRAP